MDTQAIEVVLPVHRPGEEPVMEQIPAVKIKPGHFKLLHSPGLVEGVAAGDEIELAPQNPLGYKVVKRGGNLCVWFYFREKGQNTGLEGQRLRQAVEDIGGWLDGGRVYLLIFNIPMSVGFPAVEQLFNKAAAEIPGSTWMFGNVYDPIDGRTPLGWWE